MRLIINDIFTLEQFDNEKLGKYIRCMFQAILPLDEVLALQLLDEAAGLARDGAQVSHPKHSLNHTFVSSNGSSSFTQIVFAVTSKVRYLKHILTAAGRKTIPAHGTRMARRNNVQPRH